MTRVFFDTSAVVPLLMAEKHTAIAQAVAAHCDEAWAWSWMRVEAEAALSRRRADAPAWSAWRTLSGGFQLVDLAPSQHGALCAFNRGLSLRAADAAHLFVFDRLMTAVPELRLLTFDREMRDAAAAIGLPLHDACMQG